MQSVSCPSRPSRPRMCGDAEEAHASGSGERAGRCGERGPRARTQLLGEDAAKTAHFAGALREAFQPSTDPLTMEVAAAALGHLVRSGGALTADIVEFEARARGARRARGSVSFPFGAVFASETPAYIAAPQECSLPACTPGLLEHPVDD